MASTGRLLAASQKWARKGIARWRRDMVECWLLHGAPPAERWQQMLAQRAAR